MADKQKHADTLVAPDKICCKPWQRSEPALGEALADPVVRTLMRADRIDPKELERTLRAMARKLAASGRYDQHCQAD